MTDEAGFKKHLTAPIWGKEAEIGPEKVFCPFLELGSLVFLEIAYND